MKFRLFCLYFTWQNFSYFLKDDKYNKLLLKIARFLW